MCTVPEIEDLDLKGIDTVAIDLETYDPDLKKKGSGAVIKNGFVTGIAVATKKQTLYFPIQHAMTSNLDPKETWFKLNNLIFQNEKIKKVFHNAMYDVCWIRSATGKMPKGPLLDTMIAASVIDENRMKYSLDAVSKDYLQDTKYKWDLTERSLSDHGIKDPMSNMHKLPYSLVKDYAEQDVSLTLRLWNVFEKKLKEIIYEEKQKSLQNIFDLETKLFPCLVDMKFKGVRIDVQKANEFKGFLIRRKNKITKIIKSKTGIDIQLWAASSIKQLLDFLKVDDYQITAKSKMPKLPKDYLRNHKEVLLRMVAKAREADKNLNTFVEGLLSYVHEGRIHADINQIRSDQGGTVTGRFSMSNPNLQQIPSKGFFGRKMREMFLPEEDHKWGSFDYSQQEPRIVVHYAIKILKSDPDLLQEDVPEKIKNPYYTDIVNSICKIEKSYQEDADSDFHSTIAKMANISRTQAKTISLGMFYGMGKFKLQAELGLDRIEAQDLFKRYHSYVPFVKKLSDDLIAFAKLQGLLFTLGDRFCRFEKWETTNRKWNNETRRFDPVPILTYDQAITAYKAELVDEERDPDPELNDFHHYYTPAFTYKALNKLIQGSAADMTKQAMVDLYEQGILPHIQIHDELCISVKNDTDAGLIKKTMEEAIPLLIKNKVSYKNGINWGQAK